MFGDITGIAPGYSLSLGYEQIEFFTQGEYFFDAANRSGNFFYTSDFVSLQPGFMTYRTHCADGPILFTAGGKKLVKGSVRPV